MKGLIQNGVLLSSPAAKRYWETDWLRQLFRFWFLQLTSILCILKWCCGQTGVDDERCLVLFLIALPLQWTGLEGQYKKKSTKLILLLSYSLLLLLLAYLSYYHGKATKRCTSSLRSCRPSVYHTKMGNSIKCFSQRHNKQTRWLSLHCSLNAERQAGKLWIPILKSLVWPDSELTPKSTYPEADALYHSSIWLAHSAIWSAMVYYFISRFNCDWLIIAVRSESQYTTAWYV